MPAQDYLELQILDDPLFSTARKAAEPMSPDADLAYPVLVHGELVEEPDVGTTLLRESKIERFTVDGTDFGMIWPAAGASWHGILLPSHAPAVMSESDSSSMIAAIRHLARSYPDGFGCFNRCVRLLTRLRRLATGPIDDAEATEVTSASVPTFPLWMFFSQKAAVHLPPEVIGREPSVRIMAENFYHESVHQLVNIHLLLGRLVTDEFDSETSPRVPIAWRAADSSRNREWEVDRVLHAAIVYESVMAYRDAQLTDPRLTPWERKAFEQANAIAGSNLAYLATSLSRYSYLLNTDGADIVRHLNEAAGRSASRGA
jgi:hypothetical protein